MKKKKMYVISKNPMWVFKINLNHQTPEFMYDYIQGCLKGKYTLLNC